MRFGKEVENAILIDDSFTVAYDDIYTMCADLSTPLTFTHGAEYAVELSGEYQFTGTVIYNAGNFGFDANNGSETVKVYIIENGSKIQFGIYYSDPFDCTLKITEIKTSLTPLPDEYISENIARVSDILDEGVVKQDVLPEQLRFGKETGNGEFVNTTTSDTNSNNGIETSTDSPVFFLSASVMNTNQEYTISVNGVEEVLTSKTEYSGVISCVTSNGIRIVSSPNAVVDQSVDEGMYYITLPVPGTYAMNCQSGISVIATGDFTVVTYLDSDYLPKATAIADVTDAPTAEQFNALLASLRNAGYLAE